MKYTETEIKKLVVGGRKPADSPRLFIAEHDGELYATNSYWLAPAARVAPLLAKFNLPADKPGSFTVNGSVSPWAQEPPNVGALIPRVDQCSEITPSVFEGAGVWRKGAGKNPLLRLFGERKTLQAFDDSFLSWLTYDGRPADAAVGYCSMLTGEPIYRQAGPGRPMLIHAKRRKNTSSMNANSWIDDGEQFLGLLMPVRLGR